MRKKQVEECKEPTITFSLEDKELLYITPQGMKFNRENFSDYTPDNFAREFMYILEEHFSVTFDVKDPNSEFILKHPEESDL